MMDKKKYSVGNNPESLTFSGFRGKLMKRAVGRPGYTWDRTLECGNAGATVAEPRLHAAPVVASGR